MRKYFAFLVVMVGMLATGYAQTTYPAKAVPIAGGPLTILSITPTAASVPATVPAQVRAKLTAYRTAVKNDGTLPIVAYTIRYVWADANGHPFTGKGNCETRMSDPTRPALAPGQAAELTNHIVHHIGGEILHAEIDMILTADGAVYGRNVCGGLQQFQQTLTSKRAVEEWILSVLNSQGSEKAKALLEADLSGRATVDHAVLVATHRR